MDKIKPSKNFILSRESMRAVLDAFQASLSVADATQEVAHSISPQAAGRVVPPTPASSRALVPVSKDSHSRAPKASSRSQTHSSSRSPTVPKSKPASLSTSQELIVIEESVEDVLQGRTEVAPATEGAPKESTEVLPVDKGTSKGGAEVVLATKGATKEGAKVIPTAPRPKKTATSGGITLREATGKRAPPSEIPPTAPTPKKARISKQPGAALPPGEKKKRVCGAIVFCPRQ